MRQQPLDRKMGLAGVGWPEHCGNARAGSSFTSARFPNFVVHRNVHPLRTSEGYGHKFTTGAVDLTFASVLPRVLIANVKSKTAPESYSCQCPFGSDIRKRVRSKMIRMSEPGH